jgi:hypothetical protein
MRKKAFPTNSLLTTKCADCCCPPLASPAGQSGEGRWQEQKACSRLFRRGHFSRDSARHRGARAGSSVPEKLFDAIRAAGLRIRLEDDPEQTAKMARHIAENFNPRQQPRPG